jgi:hypothetical protein
MLGSLGDAIGDFFANILRFDAGEIGEGSGPRPKGRVTVPDVRGLNLAEARHRLAQEGLRAEVHRLEERPAPVMGWVVEQDPSPGTRHRRVQPVKNHVRHPRDP